MRGDQGKSYSFVKWSGCSAAAFVLLALPGCSPKTTIAAAVSTVSGVASTAVAAAQGTVTTASATANSLGNGPSETRGVSASGGAGTIPPEIVAGTVASSAASNTGQRTELENQAIGSAISKKIIAAVLFCTNLKEIEYRLDCFADQLDQVAGEVPSDNDFGDARSIIAETAARLAEIVQRRESRDLRPVTLTSSNVAGTGSRRTVRAVATAEVPSALAEADRVLGEAETLLLRSSEASLRRSLAYTEIAEAIGSSKVLLRSI